jgi:hypothetical protein
MGNAMGCGKDQNLTYEKPDKKANDTDSVNTEGYVDLGKYNGPQGRMETKP